MPAPPLALVLFALALPAAAFAEQVLDADLHHLRRGAREWNSFGEQPAGERYEQTIRIARPELSGTLRLRQQDVKQDWSVKWNDHVLGKLTVDENDQRSYFAVPAEAVRDGDNRLVIEPSSESAKPDDIRVGECLWEPRPIHEVLSAARVTVRVRDADGGAPLPCRITIVTPDGTLQPVHAEPNPHWAVRAGTVYTSTGEATFGLPSGTFRILAGRGFEYSLAEHDVPLTAGDDREIELRIRREVATPGYVACDTHVHTLTHSGHGDATIAERMVTIAGEGIELPIATDHNKQIDYRPHLAAAGVESHFTPVVGNEVTTKVGHFNVFPLSPSSPPPDARLEDWSAIFRSIRQQPEARVIVLNHARDLHSGMRPFGPDLFHPLVGAHLRDWEIGFNAMEVVNSGATQTDPWQLFRDWMALLNHGHAVTPVGTSDSHDVARHFVGQGRTYVACPDERPGEIDVSRAVQNLLEGRVRVSYGLIAELVVQDRFTSGDLVASEPGEPLRVRLRVLGPHWVQASALRVFMNGQLVKEIAIDPATVVAPGVKWEGTVELDGPTHDVFLTALAEGPGVDHVAWKTAKPYQPTSQDEHTSVLACSGAVWIDADKDGERTPAIRYAERLLTEAGTDLPKLLGALAPYDYAVAAQAAHLFTQRGGNPRSETTQQSLLTAAPQTKAAFRDYAAAWRPRE